MLLLLLLLSTHLGSPAPRRLLLHSYIHLKYVCRYFKPLSTSCDCSGGLLAAFVFSHVQQEELWTIHRSSQDLSCSHCTI